MNIRFLLCRAGHAGRAFHGGALAGQLRAFEGEPGGGPIVNQLRQA
jgi:hypothetical protein